MSAQVRRCCVEPLENRRHADATAGDTFYYPSVSYGVDGGLHVDGSVGDDQIIVRVAKQQIYIDVTSRVVATSLNDYGLASKPVDPHNTRVNPVAGRGFYDSDTLTMIEHFVLPLRGHATVGIEGSDGDDVVTATALPIHVVATQVESANITPAAAPPGRTPSDPAAGALFGSAKAWSVKLKEQLKAAKSSRAKIAFFGDSHADRYAYYGRRSWLAAFPKALNLGIGGDNTRNMLYRIKAGLFDHFKPDTLVVMAGTNDLNNTATDGTTDQVFAGITEVIAALHRRLPNTRLVVLSIFPRGESGVNARIQDLNGRIKAVSERSGFFDYLNVYDRLADTFAKHDLVNLDNHLSAAGYHVLTRYLTAMLRGDSTMIGQ